MHAYLFRHKTQSTALRLVPPSKLEEALTWPNWYKYSDIDSSDYLLSDVYRSDQVFSNRAFHNYYILGDIAVALKEDIISLNLKGAFRSDLESGYTVVDLPFYLCKQVLLYLQDLVLIREAKTILAYHGYMLPEPKEWFTTIPLDILGGQLDFVERIDLGISLARAINGLALVSRAPRQEKYDEWLKVVEETGAEIKKLGSMAISDPQYQAKHYFERHYSRAGSGE